MRPKRRITALCPACHGVKHMRNSQRIGYGESAKAHFVKVNGCSPMVYASHFAQAIALWEQRNTVYRWKMKADLSALGGKGIEIEQRQFPWIVDPYQGVDWSRTQRKNVRVEASPDSRKISLVYAAPKDISDRVDRNGALYITAENRLSDSAVCPLPPKICEVTVDNYAGAIEISCDYTNRILWFLDDKRIKTVYNLIGRFHTRLRTDDLPNGSLRFVLIGDGGESFSRAFELREYTQATAP